jgi:hypothetical protein
MSTDVNNIAVSNINGPVRESGNSPENSPDLSRVQSEATTIGSVEPVLKRRYGTGLLYWSSVTPLFCGALGPTLTLLALSGCLDRWRVLAMPDGSRTSERDPRWVVSITALAIIIGFVANILLLMRMMGRGNPKHIQYWTIALWVVECFPPQVCVHGSCDEFRDHWSVCATCGR